MYSEEDACLVAIYIGVGMRTYSSSGLVVATASSELYICVLTCVLSLVAATASS